MPTTPQSHLIVRLQRETIKIGCPELIALAGRPTAEHLNYLDLMPGRTAATLLPDAVAEFQGRPVLYLVDDLDRHAHPGPTDEQVRGLSQLLANRSEHAVLGVVRPGDLALYPLNLDRAALNAVLPTSFSLATPDPQLFQSLASGSFALAGQASAPDYVFDEIHRLLTSADEELAGQMSPLEVLSITGRALFFRFLHDRKIVVPGELYDICPRADDLKDVFSDAERAAATCCWLDDTFNGDLLPLVDGLDSNTDSESRRRAYLKFFRQASNKTNSNVFRNLEAIMRGWKHVGASQYQMTIDWDDFDFAHIPIGVLSQVYETFSRRWDEVHAEETSVHYTPKNIARLLVEEALTGVNEPQNALVLDPACGAGAFLVLAFRHLVRLHWKKEGSRPDQKVIHRILYKQIRGFDVSESALRLAALALYITAIEVNGTTRPPKILKFPRALKDEVLFNFGPSNTDDRRQGFVLGGLSPTVPNRFNAQFDLVVGNPPWTRLRPKDKTGRDKVAEHARHNAINREFTTISRRVLAARKIEGFDVQAYDNPDNNPDLPFLWRAAEWTKPGGMIAMALPARIILKQSTAGKAAREAILRGLTVTGILNGSDLEETAVWRNMKLPFMLLFARNTPSPPDHAFEFVTPVREDALCRRAEFRIDYRSAQAVSVDSAVAKPWMLKALSVGSSLDIEVWEKIAGRGLPTVAEVWSRHDLPSSEGYNISKNLPQQSAEHLLELPDFELPESGFAIEFERLQRWQDKHRRTTANRPREATLYTPPLVIVPQAPGETRDRPKACLSERRAIAFSKSFYGYSAAGCRDAEGLARLLFLVIHSLLWHHHSLTHSSRIGASYRTILKEEIDSFPFLNPATLTAAQRRRVENLVKQLLTTHDKPWSEIDEFVFDLYGLSPHDATIVRDTARFGAPYRSARLPAARPPAQANIDAFCRYLAEMLQPFLKDVSGDVGITPIPAQVCGWNPPWRFIVLEIGSPSVKVSPAFLSGVMQDANRTAASRVIMTLPQGGLLIGLLNQLRFWSQSRARLCGLHIVRQCLSAFRQK